MENGEWAAQQNEQLLAINPLLSNSQLSTLNTQLTPLHFQEELERQCWLQGGRRQTAPAQRMLDFTRKAAKYVPKVMMTIVDKDKTPEEIQTCKDIARDLGVKLRIRSFIDS